MEFCCTVRFNLSTKIVKPLTLRKTFSNQRFLKHKKVPHDVFRRKQQTHFPLVRTNFFLKTKTP